MKSCDKNVIIGAEISPLIDTSIHNTMIGYKAGQTLIGGGANILIGELSDVTLTIQLTQWPWAITRKRQLPALRWKCRGLFKRYFSLAVWLGIGQTAGTEMLEVNGSAGIKTALKTGAGSVTDPSLTFTETRYWFL